MERAPLEEIVPTMGWGFLADNLLHILNNPRGPLGQDDLRSLNAAIEFLERALEGAESATHERLQAGGIGRIVESLTLYGYANRALQGSLAPVPGSETVKELLGELLQTCRKWREVGNLEQAEKLRPFFHAIARITLREAQTLLSSTAGSEPTWPLVQTPGLG